MKKVVAVLLIIATLCLPLCGLADTKNTAVEIFALTNDWEYIQTDKTLPKDVIYLLWIPAADCFSFTYDQEIYIYTGYKAELLMATCGAIAFEDDSLIYGVDWLFAVNDEGYTKVQAMLYVLDVANKYLK